MRQISVAVVYPIPFGSEGSFGGGERFAFELTRALARRCNARLVTIGASRRREMHDGVRIDTYRALWKPQPNNPLSLQFLRSLKDVDVIHCTSYSTLLTDLALLWGRTLGKRTFITDIGGGGYTTLARIFNVSRLATGLLPLSQFAAAQFTNHHTPSKVICGGVDTEHFSPDGVTARSGVVYVGRILPHKGLHTLIEAVPADVPLTLVGRPMHREYFATLKQLAEGRNVRFVTDAGDNRVLEELRRAAVAVQPAGLHDYYGNFNTASELWGLAVVEAMACGAPVVCTKVGAYPEVVEDGVSGVLVEPDNPQALGGAITGLLEDPARSARIGAAGRKRVCEMFTWDAVASRCLEAYAAA
jgi:alpha-maltose-1-phosphate synthase